MYPHSVYRNAAYPKYLEICLPDKHCNVGGENPTADNPACIMCKRNWNVPQQPDLTDFLCEKALPLMPYLEHLCVLGTAEPFWKDAVFRIFEKVQFHRHKEHIQFVTNTNGICLGERTAQRFFDEVVCSDISWSIDAATPETHEKIRRLPTFEIVTNNLKRWIEYRERFGGKQKHRVTIYNNINLLNVEEMTLMVELATEWGVDHMIMLPTYDQTGQVHCYDIMLNKSNVETFKKHAKAARLRANELGLKLIYSKPFHIVPPPVIMPVNDMYLPL